MKYILLDTNILLDRSFQRAPFNSPSLEVMRRCQQREFHGHVTTWSLMTLMYLMDQARDDQGSRIWTKQQITSEANTLLTFLTLVDTDHPAFAAGFGLGWADWEDAILYALADNHPQIEVILTNDKPFIKRSKALPGIKAMGPAELLKQM
jgi:predicted nucleic acid-binding protein